MNLSYKKLLESSYYLINIRSHDNFSRENKCVYIYLFFGRICGYTIYTPKAPEIIGQLISFIILLFYRNSGYDISYDIGNMHIYLCSYIFLETKRRFYNIYIRFMIYAFVIWRVIKNLKPTNIYFLVFKRALRLTRDIISIYTICVSV